MSTPKTNLWPSKWSAMKRTYVLSPQQRHVLFAYWIGESADDTSKRLGISKRTLYSYRGHVRLKLMEPTLLPAAQKAVKLKLIPKGAK